MRTWNMHAIAKGVLRRGGVGLRTHREAGKLQLELQHRRIPPPATSDGSVSPLFDDPLEALYQRYGGKPAAFACPIGRCVDVNGLSFGPGGWHPFVATLLELARGAISGYEGSSLARYYERWQPSNLLEAFIGVERAGASSLDELPSHLTYLYPWSAKSIAEADDAIRGHLQRDYAEHGRPQLTVREHGCQGHGPVSDRAGRLQFERLERLDRSLSQHGYRRECGDVSVLMIRRGDDYRCIVCSGIHRVAAMGALGHATVPAEFNGAPHVFDVREASRWVQVADGAWSQEAAERYVDHLFDFDARAWAERLGIAGGPARSPSRAAEQPMRLSPAPSKPGRRQ